MTIQEQAQALIAMSADQAEALREWSQVEEMTFEAFASMYVAAACPRRLQGLSLRTPGAPTRGPRRHAGALAPSPETDKLHDPLAAARRTAPGRHSVRQPPIFNPGSAARGEYPRNSPRAFWR